MLRTASLKTLADCLQLKKYPIGFGRLLTYLFATAGIVIIFIRWFKGLGVTTALADGRGWGLWISYDILIGEALATGTFMVAAAVYIFNLKQFYPLLRPCVLTGLIGYAIGAGSLLVDLGFPYRIWHLIIYWNFYSPLFIIGWCVMLYLTVLLLEFSPVLFEKRGWKVPLKVVRAITIPVVIAGIVISVVHQSALGAMMTIFPTKVYPLWISNYTPIFFFLTAITAGIGMLVLESYLSSSVYHMEFEKELVSKMARVIPVFLGLYLVFRVADLVASGRYMYLLQGGIAPLLFGIEIVVGTIAPIILLSCESVRRDRYKLLWSSILPIVGMALYRFNVSLIFLEGTPYTPSWMEIVVSVGLTCIGVIVYDIAVRLFSIFGIYSQAH